MKTSIHTDEVSSPPAQAAGWGLKIGAEHGDRSEKQGFGVEKWVDKPSDGRKIAETTSKTQFDAMNNSSNGKSRFNTRTPLQKNFRILLASGRDLRENRRRFQQAEDFLKEKPIEP